MEKCLWCRTPIESKLPVKRGGEEILYQACDTMCAHGIDVVNKIDILLFKKPDPEFAAAAGLTPEGTRETIEEEDENDTEETTVEVEKPEISFI